MDENTTKKFLRHRDVPEHPTREDVLEALSTIVHVPSQQYQIGLLCESMVTIIFANKKRDTKDEYVMHLRRVTINIVVGMHKSGNYDFPKFLVALLHDTQEEFRGKVMLYIIKQIFGFGVAKSVWWLSKPSKIFFFGNKHLRNKFFHLKLRFAPKKDIEVKLEDVHDNLNDMWIEYHDEKHQERKILEAKRVYLSLAKRYNLDHKSLEGAIKRAREKLAYEKQNNQEVKSDTLEKS